MTIIISAPPESELAVSSLRVPPDQGVVSSCREKSRMREVQQIDPTKFAGLLEEPSIALWAGEAAAKYQVSALDALGLLAHALFVDGER